MKLAFIILFIGSVWASFNRIYYVNQHKVEASDALAEKDYKKASEVYRSLIDSLKEGDAQDLLNLSTTLYNLNDSISVEYYSKLKGINVDSSLSSIAQLQLGVLSAKSQKLEESLSFFRQAMLYDFNNEKARFNYELIKKIIKQKEEEKSQNKNQDKQDNKDQKKDQQDSKESHDSKQEDKNDNKNNQQNQDQQNSKKDDNKQSQNNQSEGGDDKKENGQNQHSNDTKDKSQDEKARALRKKRLREMNLTEEKAKQMMAALRQQQQKYLQNMRKKQSKTADRSKPNW